MCAFGCKQLKKRVKKKLFGDPNPKLHEFDIFGLNLGTVKDVLTKQQKPLNEEGIFKIDERKLSKSESKKPKLEIEDLKLIEGMDASELKKKYKISPSKSKVLDNLLADYKKGKLAVPKVPSKTKQKKKKLNKKAIDGILQEYDELKKKQTKSPSMRFIEKLKNMDKKEFKKRFSLKSSRHELLHDMIGEYEYLKSKDIVPSLHHKLNSKVLTKSKMKQLLSDYEEHKKKELRINSKISLGSLMPLVDKIKKTFIK